MTRKRFIKKAMSYGIDRKTAQKQADNIFEDKMSYQRAFEIFEEVFILTMIFFKNL